MSTTRKAIVAGATGLTGGHLLSLLLEDKRYSHVTALVRHQNLHAHHKLTELLMDYDEMPKLPHVDDAYCCLGTTIKKAGSEAAFRKVDFDYVVAFARAAKLAGAQRFMVISALGASSKSAIFYSRVKGEMEHALREIGFEAVHIFQPSLILGERKEARAAERISIAAFNMFGWLMVGALQKYKAIESATIAKAMIHSAFSTAHSVRTHPSDKIEAMAKH